MSDRGRSLELYFVNGSPDGLVTAEMFNWTGHVLMVPRTRLVEAVRRREADYTGVYLLIGGEDGQTRLYIGETERLSGRLKQHASEKDWWDRVALITARDDGLNKAHARYLEARLCEIATSLGRKLENGNTPGGAGLSEAQTANMESFLDELRIVLPALEVNTFKDNSVTKMQTDHQGAISEDTFFMIRGDVGARARASEGKFIVLDGSKAAKSLTSAPTFPSGYARLFDELCREGRLVLDETQTHRIFRGDYAFTSPSPAAHVVLGKNTHGTLDWRVENTGQTYKDWEAARLEAASAEVAA